MNTFRQSQLNKYIKRTFKGADKKIVTLHTTVPLGHWTDDSYFNENILI